MASKMSDSVASEFTTQYKLPAYEALLGPSELDDEEGDGGVLPEALTGEHTEKKAATGWASVAGAPDLVNAGKSVGSLSGAAASKATAEDWYEIPEAKMTPELRRDLVLLENRAHLDPKRFYKSTGTGRKRGELPSRVHVGVVVEAPHEFLSGRLTNKERKQSFADEIFSDERIMDNTRRRFAKLQDARLGNKRVIDPASRAIRKRNGRR